MINMTLSGNGRPMVKMSYRPEKARDVEDGRVIHSPRHLMVTWYDVVTVKIEGWPDEVLTICERAGLHPKDLEIIDLIVRRS